MNVWGLPLLIDWSKFKPDTSFFIPCINRREVQKMVSSEVKRLGLTVKYKQVIEHGVYGLRVWRCRDTLPLHSASPLRED